MKKRSLKSYEDAWLDARAKYYEARMWCRQHPKSVIQIELAAAAKQKSLEAFNALLAEETALGLRGFPK